MQKEWEKSYRNEAYQEEYKKELKPKLIADSITEEEIEEAIRKTGKKGLAWDCISMWAVKLISMVTAEELVMIAH